MKKAIRNLTMAALAVVMMSSVTIAQEKKSRVRGERPGVGVATNLNDEQRAIMKANAESMKAGRAALEATFTAEQQKINASKDMAPMDRRKALEASFTAEQKALAEKNREEAKAAREKFTSSLTDEQKAAMKDRKPGGRGSRTDK